MLPPVNRSEWRLTLLWRRFLCVLFLSWESSHLAPQGLAVPHLQCYSRRRLIQICL